jgi:ribonucleotide reductase alpha subunit
MLEGYAVSLYEENLFDTRYKNPLNPSEQTWESLFRRVADAVADGDEQLADMFHQNLCAANFIPSSPQLWNYKSGRRFPRNGSSCFTGKLGDTLDTFRDADRDAENIYVASGGFGIISDDGRPRGCKIHHCSEGAMGTMCDGGPVKTIEATTGYITGSGRARGALMVQKGAQHPDAIEFILAKRPTAVAWCDDWPTNARAVLDFEDVARAGAAEWLIERFNGTYLREKDWPQAHDVQADLDAAGYDIDHLDSMVDAGIVIVDDLNRVVPTVNDWQLYGTKKGKREANRDWDLPMQNCNTSVRVPDALMHASQRDDDWVFHWFSKSEPKAGNNSWTKTDCLGDGLKEYEDGRFFTVPPAGTDVLMSSTGDAPYKYGVVITTWEGLRQNMSPNQNQWRDTAYSRFYRTHVVKAIGRFTGNIKARQVLKLIYQQAWNHGLGIVFSDTYERFQPVDSAVYGPRLSNPCSEYVNSAGGSCNLASVNLRKCAEDALGITGPEAMETAADWEEIKNTRRFQYFMRLVGERARDAMVYIAHALEYNEAPVEYIQRMTIEDFRTVGVGFLGLAEALMIFHVRYGSVCGRMFSAAVMSEIALSSWEVSFELATSGWAIPKGWNQARMQSIFAKRVAFVSKFNGLDDHNTRWEIILDEVESGRAASHTCVTSVAPTGTIAQVAGFMMSRAASNGITINVKVEHGCEPSFGWVVGRQDNSGSTVIVHDLWTEHEHHAKPWMVTASQIPAREHVLMQAAICAFCCMSVSKTVNLPEAATLSDVQEAYELAWSEGIPGTTVYRDRSKPMQVLTALDCPGGECGVETEVEEIRI